MFLIDDILCSPIKGLMYVFREIHNVVELDAGNEAQAIRTELGELYMLLETSQITEAEADAREKELLDRLEAIEARGQDDAEAEEETDDAEARDETDDAAAKNRNDDIEGKEDTDDSEAAESPPTSEELSL